MPSKLEDLLTPLFLALLLVHVALVVMQRTGIPLPFPDRVIGGLRIAVSIAILAILMIWSFEAWRRRRKGA